MGDVQKIEQLIENLRECLHDLLHGRRLTHPEVLKASQELDNVLNEYERLRKAKCKDSSGRI